ncbi:MAG: molecular chaperone DnaK [Candidatus Eremiobacteraeota bacterium]|nr:molecular chaperone DnaK [Candidatus Eremiobacteraeota bacterium]
MAKVVGIDLGTTNSVVAILEGGKPVVIPNAEGSRLTPSVVAFTKTGERLVGELAKRQAVVNPENTVYSIKRFMGRFMTEVNEEMKLVPYQVVAGPQGEARVRLQGKDYTPQEISSMILQKLKTDAERYLGESVTKAVITVPAYFNDAQRTATKEAGQVAGLEVLRIINEPTASCMAYGMDKQDETLTILVFDLGGGTFDVSILEAGGGVFQVKATNGDTHLGGDNWDQLLIDWMAEKFKAQNGIDLRKDRMALQRLKEAAEKAKIELSQVTQTNESSLPFTADASGAKHLDVTITRSEFEKMSLNLVERCANPTRQAISDAGLTPEKIDRILLVGGATRMPMIQEFVKRFFGKDPHKDINPDECVALGAAVQAGVLVGEVKNIVLVDVTPLSLGVEVLGGYVEKMIERNTAIPTSGKKVFTTAADSQTAVEVHVIQGERAMAGDNKSLGKFMLTDIPPAPRGIPQIEVNFEIDSNGILNVTAKDLASGKQTGIRLTGSTNLPKTEIDKMIKESEAYAESDKKKKEEAEVKSQADSLIYTTEKTLKDIPNVDSALKGKAEEGMKKLKEAMDSNDMNRIKSESESLKQVLYEVSSSVYAQAGAAAGGSGGKTVWTPQGEHPVGNEPSSPGGNGGVIDADYRVEGDGEGKK